MDYQALFSAVDSARPRWDLIHRVRFDGDVTDEAERRAILDSLDELETSMLKALEILDTMAHFYREFCEGLCGFFEALDRLAEELEMLVAQSVYKYIRKVWLIIAKSKMATWVRSRTRLELGLSSKIAVVCPCYIVAVWEPP